MAKANEVDKQSLPTTDAIISAALIFSNSLQSEASTDWLKHWLLPETLLSTESISKAILYLDHTSYDKIKFFFGINQVFLKSTNCWWHQLTCTVKIYITNILKILIYVGESNWKSGNEYFFKILSSENTQKTFWVFTTNDFQPHLRVFHNDRWSVF